MRKVSRVMSTKEIRGVKFHVESCFNGDKDITEKVADMIKKDLHHCKITEISLRNGTVHDCSGCPFKMCMHFSEKSSCYYGGVIVEQVYPAIEACDAVVLLCPNYNDALSANLTAFINRLTALFRKNQFYEKSIFALVVSGYSGGISGR